MQLQGIEAALDLFRHQAFDLFPGQRTLDDLQQHRLLGQKLGIAGDEFSHALRHLRPGQILPEVSAEALKLAEGQRIELSEIADLAQEREPLL